jgi:dTDP-4-dehydrorhamnose reductase
MQIAIIGSNGQIGSEIVRAAKTAGLQTIELRHSDCDVTDGASVTRALSPLRSGDIVVNTAAFHKTDECEDAGDRALSVNALGAFRVAAAAHRQGATAVYLSSDFVFDGTKRTPYVESDQPNPINLYGVSKLTGETLLRIANPHHYVIRVSAVFGPAGSSGKGGNFVESMVAKARAGTAPDVVDDIVMAPTSAVDAAGLLVSLFQRRAPFGIYHLANMGACSWLEFTDAIFELVGSAVRARPIKAASLNGKARRPLYSVLASERLRALGLNVRDWREALRDYLQYKGYLNNQYLRPA